MDFPAAAAGVPQAVGGRAGLGELLAMREIFCAQCGASILAEDDDDLARCPSCGREPLRLSRAQQLEAAKAAARAGIPKKPVGCATVLLLCLVAPCGLLGIMSGLGALMPRTSRAPTSPEAVEFAQEIEARAQAESLVREQFDARIQHTARFPALRQFARQGKKNDRGESVWVVDGEAYVRNAFNAELRYDYRVVLHLASGGVKPIFKPIRVDLNGETVYASRE